MPDTFPSDWREQPCYIVAIPKPLVPYVGGMLKMLENRGFWVDDSTYQEAYAATVELESCLMATCLSDLMALQEAQYRLMNTALFGQVYEATGDPMAPVTPSIAQFVDLTVLDQNSVMGRLDRITKLVDNAINGVDNDLYSVHPSVKELLQGIIDALGADDSDLGDILEQLEAIALLVG